MRRHFAFFTGFLLALLLTVGGVSAQDATPEATGTAEATSEATVIQPLSYGTPVTGTIDGKNFTQDWPLSTASADRIQVQVTRTSGNLIPNVQILDASGTAIAQSYGADYTYAAAQIDDFTLPAAGNYTIEVGRENGETGVTKGGYSLAVLPLGTAADNPNNVTVIGEVQADTPVSGEITATHWQHLYTYNAPAADALDVVVERTSGTLMPQVDVLDANGTSLRTGYNNLGSAETGEFELPSAGAYTIAVHRNSDQSGDTLGTYDLTVKLVGAGEGSPLLVGAAGTAVYDQELTGTLTPAQWYQDWSLTTDAGDTLTITLTRAGGDLMPEVVLLGGSGQELSHGYTDNAGASAQIKRYQLAGPGTYTVRATRQNGQTGVTSGAYGLTIALNGTGEGSPRLSEPAGEITPGTAVQGEITNALWQNVWTFNSSAGGSIDVQVTRADGTLIPNVIVRDANGQEMRRGYPSDARDSAEISGFSLPGPGKYQIVVSRDGDQGGYTSGSYTLTVSPAAQ